MFKLCTQFLSLLGRLMHLSYNQISVLFNLYLQGALLLLSGMLPFLASLLQAVAHPGSISILTTFVLFLYATLYVAGGILLYRHYPPRWDKTFWRCVYDLRDVAALLHVSYQVLNLLLFVVWWLALIGVNLLLSYLLFKAA